MKININGYAQHGKDTVAEMISRKYGLKNADASRHIAARLVSSRLPKGWYSGTFEEQVEACYNDRINHRDGWFSFIGDYGADLLTDEILSKGDLRVGYRRDEVFQRHKPRYEATLWVTAVGRVGRIDDDPRCDISEDGHDYIIENNSTLEDLEVEVERFWTWLQQQSH